MTPIHLAVYGVPAPMGSVPGWALQGQLCPRCGRPMLSFDKDRFYFDVPRCSPLSDCSAWRTVGKSRNGGPMLTLVDNDGPDSRWDNG